MSLTALRLSLSNRVPLLQTTQHVLRYAERALAAAIAGALLVAVDANARFVFKHSSHRPPRESEHVGCSLTLYSGPAFALTG